MYRAPDWTPTAYRGEAGTVLGIFNTGLSAKEKKINGKIDHYVNFVCNAESSNY